MAVGALVHDYLRQAASRTPHRAALSVAVECGDSEPGIVTFAEVDEASDRLAATLQAAGVGRGDRVAIMGESSAELVVALWATLKAGGVFVLVNPTTKHDKLAYVLDDCEACVLVVQSTLTTVVGQALAAAPSVSTVVWIEDAQATHGESDDNGDLALGDRAQLDFGHAVHGDPTGTATSPIDPGLIDADLAGLIYTSGSNGRPRGVMLTHNTVVHNTWAVSTLLGLRHDDVVACVLPLSFDYGLFQLFTAARVGCAVALERSFFPPDEVLARLSKARVTVVPGVPTTFATLLEQVPFPEELDLSTVRMLTNSGAPLSPTSIRNLRGLFPTAQLFSMYGLAECTRVSYLHPHRLADKIASVGKAIPNSEAYVVDEQGRRAAPAVVGELVVRGANVMQGYWGRPEQTAAYLRDGEISGQKVLHTGDQFFADEEGFLYFVGRHDDMFTCQGQRVSPKEIENVLYEIESIAEAGVVGVPDEIDGMAIKAVVAARPDTDLTADDVRAHCERRLERHLVPRHVEVREALPKTPSGKIRKAALLQS